MNKELIKRKRTKTIGPINELKKYLISFLRIANIKTNLNRILLRLLTKHKCLLTHIVYNLLKINNPKPKESNYFCDINSPQTN